MSRLVVGSVDRLLDVEHREASRGIEAVRRSEQDRGSMAGIGERRVRAATRSTDAGTDKPLRIIRRELDRDVPVGGQDPGRVERRDTAFTERDRLPVEHRVGQEADAGGGVVVDRRVPSTGKGPLKDPRRLAHLAMADRRDHGRQDHRAHQQDDQHHDQQLDQREPAPARPAAALRSSIRSLPVHRSRPSDAAGRLAVLVADVVTAVLAAIAGRGRRMPSDVVSGLIAERGGWSRSTEQ